MDVSPDAPFPTVQLRHELPDGTWHIDWMIAQDDAGRHPLITFRASGRVDELADDARLELQRLDDHRPVYLTYEGALSENRGLVRCIARGRIVGWASSKGAWTLHVIWENSGPAPLRQTLKVHQKRRDAWVVSGRRTTG